jgi:hypothetical protein
MRLGESRKNTMTWASGCSSAGQSQPFELCTTDRVVQTEVNGPNSRSGSHVQHPMDFLFLINNRRQLSIECQGEHMMLKICHAISSCSNKFKFIFFAYRGGRFRSVQRLVMSGTRRRELTSSFGRI